MSTENIENTEFLLDRLDVEAYSKYFPKWMSTENPAQQTWFLLAGGCPQTYATARVDCLNAMSTISLP